MPKKLTDAQRTKMKLAIIDFATKHNLIIHPGAGYNHFIDNYEKYGSCACDPKRKKCPCSEAIDEVKNNGACKCQLFWENLAVFRDRLVTN